MAGGAAPLSAATSNASVEEKMKAKEKKDNFKTVSKLWSSKDTNFLATVLFHITVANYRANFLAK